MSSPDPSPSGADLSHAIRTVRAGYHARGVTDYDIGNGYCETFADEVLDLWIGEGWQPQEWQNGRWGTLSTGEVMLDEDAWDWPLVERRYGASGLDGVDREALDRVAIFGPTHVWIEHDGRCYDCEHPDGVKSCFDLNFFKRWAEIDLDHLRGVSGGPA